MKKINIKIDIRRLKSIKLGLYFSILMSAIIIAVTMLFSLYILFNIKELEKNYELDIYTLRYSISTMLAQTLQDDIKRKEFTSTKNIIDILKDGKQLEYAYIKDSETDKTVFSLGEDDEEIQKAQTNPNIQNLSKNIDTHTIYFGIQTKSKMSDYFQNFYKLLPFIVIIFVSMGIFVSFFMARFLTRPLEKLLKAAKHIADGHFDVKLDNTSFSEINDLIYSYNEMTFQLNELYSSLELKVQERTIALEEANYKLQETQAMMVHSEKMRSLGELVAGIAHEINNPVNFIHGNIMILQNYVDDLMRLIDLFDNNSANFPQNIKDEIEKVKKDIDLDFLRTDVNDLIKSCIEGTQRTKNIILDLKNFSRMEEMVLTQFDIPKEIDTTLNILNNKYKNRIDVVKNYKEDVPKIEAFGGQLNQVFMNILDNAQDAMGASGTLTINIYRVDSEVKIEFIDTGAGIPKENLAKVFDPFFTTKAVGKGTGLGMSISYRVIKDHNGKIEVESEVGVGTKFTITLPINHSNSQNHCEKSIIG